MMKVSLQLQGSKGNFAQYTVITTKERFIQSLNQLFIKRY